ncbi:NACHT domain-containing protein [Streptomyces sp. NPDC001705]
MEYRLAAPARHRAEGAANSGTLQGIHDYYRALQPQRLVVTGEPGSGKTVLAQQLVLRLLETRDQHDLVPIRCTLANWQPDQEIQQWLGQHLTDTYGLSAAAARELVKARRILPVLDGLDEMDRSSDLGYASRAGHAVRALNAYQQYRSEAPCVLTCRSHTYESLLNRGIWVRGAARIEIAPVTEDLGHEYLSHVVDDPDRWQPVFNELRREPSGPLAQALSTPWRLSLAATVYEQRDEGSVSGDYLRNPDRLIDSSLATADAIGFHLLDLLVPAATAARNRIGGVRQDAGAVRRVLTALANHLQVNPYEAGTAVAARTDLLPHQLWTLAGPRRVRRTVTALVVALVLPALLLVPLDQDLLWTSTLAAIALIYTRDLGPRLTGPLRLDVYRLLSGSGRRWLRSQLASGLKIALLVMITTGCVAALVLSLFSLLAALGLPSRSGRQGSPSMGWPVAVLLMASGFGTAAFLAWMALSWTRAPRALASVRPGDAIRNNAITSLFASACLGLWATVCAYATAGPLASLILGVWVSTVTGIVCGQATLYYVALLLTARCGSTRLPWRTLRLLNWLYEAGLLRQAGVAYQFRHKELQDHLTS